MFYHIQNFNKNYIIQVYINTFKSNSKHITFYLQPSIVVFKPHSLTVTMVTNALTIMSTYVSLQPKYTMYINIKELTKEDTQLIPSSSPFPYLRGGDQLQVGLGVLSREICNLTHTRTHIEVQAFIPILAYSYCMGFHLYHCQHTKSYAGAWNTFIC